MAFAGTTDEAGITGTLYNCRKGYPGDFPTEVSGYIALIERGKTDESSPDFYFWEKVYNALEAGAVAVIVYNNVSNDPFDGWTLGTSGDWPPVVCISQESGLALGEMDTSQATVINQLVDTSFGYMSSTSMAAPHVSGVAGLILSKNPHLGYSAVRSAILNTVDKISSVSDKLVLGGRVNAYAAVAEFLEPGDVSGNHNLGLEDIILALQVAADMKPDICADFIQRGVDVNGDRKIGLEESIYVMQKVAELK
jgi:subtilisin family serine protease